MSTKGSLDVIFDIIHEDKTYWTHSDALPEFFAAADTWMACAMRVREYMKREYPTMRWAVAGPIEHNSDSTKP